MSLVNARPDGKKYRSISIGRHSVSYLHQSCGGVLLAVSLDIANATGAPGYQGCLSLRRCRKGQDEASVLGRFHRGQLGLRPGSGPGEVSGSDL